MNDEFHCPDCYGPTEVEDGVGWWCLNNKCSLSKKFYHEKVPLFSEEKIKGWMERNDWSGSFNAAKTAMEDAATL